MMVNMALSDNPVLLKHVRSRLRLQHMWPAVAGVVLICMSIIWAAIQSTSPDRMEAGFDCLVALQALILFLMGTGQAASSMARAQESGMLDFHRITPQPPLATALGFVLGAPIREYVLFLCTLPFALPFVLSGHPGPVGFAEVVVAMLASAFLYHCFGALIGATASRSAPVVVGIVVALYVTSQMSTAIASLTILPTMAALSSHHIGDMFHSFFYGAPVAAPTLALIHEAPLSALLLVALTRKMRRDRMRPYSKPVAIVFQVILAALVVGDLWPNSGGSLPWSVSMGMLQTVSCLLAILTISGSILAAEVAPDAGELASGVRRALKQGSNRVPAWSDAATNLATTFWIAGITLAAGAALSTAPFPRPDSPERIAEVSILAVFVILYFGSARQFFDARYGKRGRPLFGLLLFCTWILPLLIALIASTADLPLQGQQGMLCLSPLSLFVVVADHSVHQTAIALGVGLSGLLSVVFTVLAIRASRALARSAGQRADCGEEHHTTVR